MNDQRGFFAPLFSLTGAGAVVVAGALAATLLTAGCTVTPDPCAGWTKACLSVTVTSGPADTYQLLVAVLDGYGSTTPLTPRQPPHTALVYPLRFALRFGEFDPFHKGTITFTVEAQNHTSDVIGSLEKVTQIQGYEHQSIEVALGPPADLGSTDLAEPDLAPPNAADAATAPPDLYDLHDLRTLPDMP